MLAELDELLLGALPGKVAEVEHLRRRLRVPELRRPRGRHRRLCGGLRLIGVRVWVKERKRDWVVCFGRPESFGGFASTCGFGDK